MLLSETTPYTVRIKPKTENSNPMGYRRSSFIVLPEDDVQDQCQPQHDHTQRRRPFEPGQPLVLLPRRECVHQSLQLLVRLVALGGEGDHDRGDEAGGPREDSAP